MSTKQVTAEVDADDADANLSCSATTLITPPSGNCDEHSSARSSEALSHLRQTMVNTNGKFAGWWMSNCIPNGWLLKPQQPQNVRRPHFTTGLTKLWGFIKKMSASETNYYMDEGIRNRHTDHYIPLSYMPGGGNKFTVMTSSLQTAVKPQMFSREFSGEGIWNPADWQQQCTTTHISCHWLYFIFSFMPLHTPKVG